MPYNIRELFTDHPFAAIGGLSLAALVLAVMPWVLAQIWSQATATRLTVSLFGTALAGTVVFAALMFVVPTESIDDIVGTPVLDIGPTWERGLRFVGLVLGLLWAQAAGVFWQRNRFALQRRWLAWWIVWLIGMSISYWVVVPGACTDNVTELLRGTGYSPGVVGLPLWLATTASAVANLVAGEPTGSTRWRHRLVAAVWLMLSFAAGWVFVNMALEPEVTKYGETFSALQFLLSKDRGDYLPPWQLPLRFAIVHTLLIAGLIVGWLVARVAQPPLSRFAAEVRR